MVYSTPTTIYILPYAANAKIFKNFIISTGAACVVMTNALGLVISQRTFCFSFLNLSYTICICHSWKNCLRFDEKFEFSSGFWMTKDDQCNWFLLQKLETLKKKYGKLSVLTLIDTFNIVTAVAPGLQSFADFSILFFTHDDYKCLKLNKKIPLTLFIICLWALLSRIVAHYTFREFTQCNNLNLVLSHFIICAITITYRLCSYMYTITSIFHTYLPTIISNLYGACDYKMHIRHCIIVQLTNIGTCKCASGVSAFSRRH